MKMTPRIFTRFMPLLFPLLAGAQDWATPRDSEGWSILTPSADSRLIYVSQADGDDRNARPYTLEEIGGDPHNPAIEVVAYASAGYATQQLRDGYPDWFLLKAGETFDRDFRLDLFGVGRSKDERKVLTYYGDGSQRPVVQGLIHSYRSDFINEHAGLNYWAIVGLELYYPEADPNSPDYLENVKITASSQFLTGGDYLLIEDCVFRFVEVVVQGDDLTANGYGRTWKHVEFRRCSLLDTYYYNSCNDFDIRPSGMYVDGAEDYLIEENFCDYGGWNPDVEGAGRNMFNHGFYLNYNNGGDLYFRGNIITRSSGNAAQCRSGGVVELNLTLQCPAGLYVNRDTTHGAGATDGLTAIRYNVAMEGIGMGDCPQSSGANFSHSLGDQIETGTVFQENIASHNLDFAGTIGIYSDSGANFEDIDNIIYDWGRGDMWDAGWNDPERTLGGFYASVGGAEATTEAYLAWLRTRGLHEMPAGMSAYSAINYIREGFNLEPVSVSYGSGNPDSWQGYPLTGGWISTGDYAFGNTYVENDPWLYLLNAGKWRYFPGGDLQTQEGNWFFIPKPEAP